MRMPNGFFHLFESVASRLRAQQVDLSQQLLKFSFAEVFVFISLAEVFVSISPAVNRRFIMPRVLRTRPHSSQHHAASTAQAATVTSHQARGSRRTRGRGGKASDRSPQLTATTTASTTSTGRGRRRRISRKVTEQPGVQLSRQEDPVLTGDLEQLQSVIRSEIQQALAAAFPQLHPRPTDVSGLSPIDVSCPPSASPPAGGTPAIPTSQVGTSSCTETGLGGCVRTSKYVW